MAVEPLQLAVVGAAECDEALAGLAREVGRRAAGAGAVVITGGRGGVMAAASAGAREAGGLAVGILPGADASSSSPNSHLNAAVYTGMGQARNQIVVLSGAAVIAIGGGWGTLSEIALALKHRVPVITLESWTPKRPDGRREPGLARATSPAEAVERALEAARRAGRSPIP